MSAGARIAAFAAVLALVFGGAAALGSVLDPGRPGGGDDAHPPATTAMPAHGTGHR